MKSQKNKKIPRAGFFCLRCGAGLGLYHAKTAVESWGGEFAIRSKPGLGVEVQMSFTK